MPRDSLTNGEWKALLDAANEVLEREMAKPGLGHLPLAAARNYVQQQYEQGVKAFEERLATGVDDHLLEEEEEDE